MMKNWFACGLLGMTFGLGFAAEPASVDPEAVRGAGKQEREACLRRSMDGAPDIYAFRELGRAEARMVGVRLDGGAGQIRPEDGRSGHESSRDGAMDIYALRRPGREEAHEVRVPGYAADQAAAVRRPGKEFRVYELRRLGREEAHEIAGICTAPEKEAN